MTRQTILGGVSFLVSVLIVGALYLRFRAAFFFLISFFGGN